MLHIGWNKEKKAHSNILVDSHHRQANDMTSYTKKKLCECMTLLTAKIMKYIQLYHTLNTVDVQRRLF